MIIIKNKTSAYKFIVFMALSLRVFKNELELTACHSSDLFGHFLIRTVINLETI